MSFPADFQRQDALCWRHLLCFYFCAIILSPREWFIFISIPALSGRAKSSNFMDIKREIKKKVGVELFCIDTLRTWYFFVAESWLWAKFCWKSFIAPVWWLSRSRKCPRGKCRLKVLSRFYAYFCGEIHVSLEPINYVGKVFRLFFTHRGLMMVIEGLKSRLIEDWLN